jgi:hypothetical protein
VIDARKLTTEQKDICQMAVESKLDRKKMTKSSPSMGYQTNKILTPILLCMLVVQGCLQNKVCRTDSILKGELMGVEYTDIDKFNNTRHLLPTVYFNVRLTNMGSVPYLVNIDSISQMGKYKNFLTILRRDQIPHIRKLTFDGCDARGRSNEGGQSLSYVPSELVLDPKKTLDIVYKYSENDYEEMLATSGVEMKGMTRSELDSIYLVGLKKMINREVFYITLWIDKSSFLVITNRSNVSP